jgi:hypothetical protein
MPTLFARPAAAARIPLDAEPMLEGWHAANHPDQLRLRAYEDAVAAHVGSSGWPAHEPATRSPSRCQMARSPYGFNSAYQHAETGPPCGSPR